MKREYEEPVIIIQRFPDQDVIVCSWGENPDDPDEPIFNSVGPKDD